MVDAVGLKKKKKKKPQTIEGERTPEEREEIKETKTIAERAAQFQEEKRRQEAADPLLLLPSSGIEGGVTATPTGRSIFTRNKEAQAQVAQAQRLTPRPQAGAAGEVISESLGRQVSNVLEGVGAFEQVTPQETDLTPSESPIPTGDIPLISPSAAALQNIFFESERTGKINQLDEGDSRTPETLREAALRQIRQDAFDKGISDGERFGTLIESIPVVGQAARAWAGGLTEAPSANADQVIAEIDKIKEAASTGQEKVRNNLEDPEYGLGRARGMEEDVAKLKGRLQLLINSSPILRANTDEMNKIQEGILEAEEKISRYRNAASFGLTAQLTGTGRVVPTDEQIFFELKGG
jgi:hypothetical protein